jgi:hypothetical protein
MQLTRRLDFYTTILTVCIFSLAIYGRTLFTIAHCFQLAA